MPALCQRSCGSVPDPDNDQISPRGCSLSIFYTNGEFLLTKMQELHARTAGFSHDVVAFMETWSRHAIKDTELAIMEYKLFRIYHADDRHKGG